MDKDNRGGTALMAAKREGHKEIVRILKEAGAKE
jgi:ankyrin repeat protein